MLKGSLGLHCCLAVWECIAHLQCRTAMLKSSLDYIFISQCVTALLTGNVGLHCGIAV